MHRKKICLLLTGLTVLWLVPAVCFSREGGTVKGKIVQSDRSGFDISFADLELRLIQQFELHKPPLPANWDKMDIKQREAWMSGFRESDQGKKLIANNQKIRDGASVFDVKVENDGRFAVYDVPHGRYGLRGRVDKELNNRKFAFEIFGQIEILKDVDELVLDPIMIMVTPLLEVGQTAPEFKVKTHDNSGHLVTDQFRGKYLFLNFWSTESPPSVEFQVEVQKMLEALESKQPLEVLSVSIDTKRDTAITHIRRHKLRGRHGFTDGWHHRMLEDFGVRAIPSHWLIGPDGKIIMTHMDFRRAFLSGQPDLATIIGDRIQGKDQPTPADGR